MIRQITIQNKKSIDQIKRRLTTKVLAPNEIETNKHKRTTIKSNDKDMILISSINEDLKNYWIEIPEESNYTVEDVLEVAIKIFERIPSSNKTTRVYNAYISVFGSAKRTDLAYAVYNAIGMFGAKWMAYGYLFFTQDLDLIISSGKVAIIGIGIGAFLTTRFAMITMLKEVILAQGRKASQVKRDLNNVEYRQLYKMTPQEIRNYMFTFLMGALLKNGNLNEALIVLHHMTNNEAPLNK
ncbi:9453_t:CDS:2, partial [Racocetra fulgida]